MLIGTLSLDKAVHHARKVADLLRTNAGIDSQVKPIRTAYDIFLESGGRTRETPSPIRELLQLLSAGEIDAVVVPAEIMIEEVVSDENFSVFYPERLTPFEAVIMLPRVWSEQVPLEMKKGAILAVDTPLRQLTASCQRPDLRLTEYHGSSAARLNDLKLKYIDAIMLSAYETEYLQEELKGLQAVRLLPEIAVPQPGQGGAIILSRSSDHDKAEVFRLVHDEIAFKCLEVEKKVYLGLPKNQRDSTGILCTLEDDYFKLSVFGKIGEGESASVLRNEFRSGSTDELIEFALDFVHSPLEK